MNVFNFFNGAAKVYGIIGNPIEHSFSPVLQNSLLDFMGSNGVYVPFKVDENDIEEAIKGLFKLNFEGINVTVPHKKSVIKYLCGLDNTAQKVGAVNTLKRTNNGFVGYNTDIIGLEKSFNINKIDVSNKVAMLIGAGGAANAVAVLLAQMGASDIIFVNRTFDNAKKLKNKISSFYSGNVHITDFEEMYNYNKPYIVINATSVGMGNGVWESPVKKEEFFNGVEYAFDVIYIPWKTKFLSDAEKYGCKCINGFDMLIYQGIASYEIWHDITIDKKSAVDIKNVLSDFFLNGGGDK